MQRTCDMTTTGSRGPESLRTGASDRGCQRRKACEFPREYGIGGRGDRHSWANRSRRRWPRRVGGRTRTEICSLRFPHKDFDGAAITGGERMKVGFQCGINNAPCGDAFMLAHRTKARNRDGAQAEQQTGIIPDAFRLPLLSESQRGPSRAALRFLHVNDYVISQFS